MAPLCYNLSSVLTFKYDELFVLKHLYAWCTRNIYVSPPIYVPKKIHQTNLTHPCVTPIQPRMQLYESPIKVLLTCTDNHLGKTLHRMRNNELSICILIIGGLLESPWVCLMAFCPKILGGGGDL